VGTRPHARWCTALVPAWCVRVSSVGCLALILAAGCREVCQSSSLWAGCQPLVMQTNLTHCCPLLPAELFTTAILR
jgi:hypothetical protein